MLDQQDGNLQRLLDVSPGVLGYAWLLLLAVWGGTANYVSRIRKHKTPFSLAELLGEWVISGFAGVVTAYACWEMGWSYYATAAAVGIGGHMGGRAIGLMEHWFLTSRVR